MKIAGVDPGAEVITTPLTCIAGNQLILKKVFIQKNIFVVGSLIKEV